MTNKTDEKDKKYSWQPQKSYSRTLNKFTIVGEEYVGYRQGNAYIVSDGVCKFSLWESKEDAQKVCDYLNEQQATISTLKEENSALKKFIKDNVDSDDYKSLEMFFKQNKDSDGVTFMTIAPLSYYKKSGTTVAPISDASERFGMHKWRRDATTPFNHFRIIDKKGKIPYMYFLTEEEMIIVYNLLKDKRMVFSRD